MVDNKICSQCKELKLANEFHKCKKFKSGLAYKCKQCVREYQQKYLQLSEVKKRMRRYSKLYAEAHKGRLVATQRKYRSKESTKRQRAEYAKEYRKRDYVYEYNAERQRLWRKDNPQQYKVMVKRIYNRYSQSYLFRLNNSIRNAMCTSMKKRGLSKNRLAWEKLAGYTAIELKKHLESQFVEGMTWENYGKWHIDHIIPISFFQYKTPDDVEFKMCWRLENLQPLWAKDNFAKRDKLKIAS